jgi:drug/metabolite transporter (DMT)-like permease
MIHTTIKQYFLFFMFFITFLKLMNLTIRKQGLKYFTSYELLFVTNIIITLCIFISSFWLIRWRDFWERLNKYTIRIQKRPIKILYLLIVLGLLTFVNIIIYYEFIRIYDLHYIIPILSVVYILGTQFVGYLMFNEQINLKQIIAVLFLCVGIFLMKV